MEGRGFPRAIELKADSAELAEVRRFVEEAAQDAGLQTERIFDLKVAVSEACANAVEHAGRDSDTFSVEATLEVNKLTFVVSDSGVFRPPVLPRQTSQNLGLGLPLMVALMDEVQFCRAPGGGTMVKLGVLL